MHLVLWFLSSPSLSQFEKLCGAHFDSVRIFIRIMHEYYFVFYQVKLQIQNFESPFSSPLFIFPTKNTLPEPDF